MKRGNEYLQTYGKLYAGTPKAVFAAIALSLAFIDVEEAGFDLAVKRVLKEWWCLHQNGIVPQKPPMEVAK